MELDAFDGIFAMPDAHDFAFCGFRRDFQAGGQRVALDNEGMVARGFKRLRQAAKYALALVLNQRCFAVHNAVIAHHVAAERRADALMPQAHAENRDFAREPLYQGER